MNSGLWILRRTGKRTRRAAAARCGRPAASARWQVSPGRRRRTSTAASRGSAVGGRSTSSRLRSAPSLPLDHVQRHPAAAGRELHLGPDAATISATCAASRGGSGASSSTRATSPRVALTMWLTARPPPVALAERAHGDDLGGPGRPGRGVRAGAQVDDEAPGRQRRAQRRAPARGERAQPREPRGHREPVGRDAVVRPHDAPERARDQHALAGPPPGGRGAGGARRARRCRRRRPAPPARCGARRSAPARRPGGRRAPARRAPWPAGRRSASRAPPARARAPA